MDKQISKKEEMMQENKQHFNDPVVNSIDKSFLNSQHDNKVIITVCVGSSCHLSGSYEIIRLIKELIRSNALEQKVTLKGSFCMENCTEGVNVKINDELFSIASVDEMKEIFQDKVTSTLDK